MNFKLIIDILLLGPVSAGVLYLFLKYFFHNSVLFKIGMIVGIFGIVMANIIKWTTGLGSISYFITIPGAFISLALSFRFLTNTIKAPLIQITEVFDRLKVGDIDSANSLTINTKDEFGRISQSANGLIDGFKSMANFAGEIGRGNLDSQFKVLGKKDKLGNSLISMQNSLIIAKKEDDKRKDEDKKVYWANEGFAKFGDLLRTNSENSKDFYFNIISNLVKYVGANQGGLFLMNDDEQNDPHLELVAMYAFDRRKFSEKRIELGENLVGQCVLEGLPIFMTEIPQNYIRITSGLGDANPSNLLLVPLKFNDKVYGVVELASFYIFEEYKRNFVEKIGESIASTISTYKINLRTIKLLRESKLQSEELAAQEEEIRQNMEELQTTQEESARRINEMSNILNAIQNSILMVEMDLKGRIIDVTPGLADLIGQSQSSMIGNDWQKYLIANQEIPFSQVLEAVHFDGNFKRNSVLNSNISVSENFHIINSSDGFPLKIIDIMTISN